EEVGMPELVAVILVACQSARADGDPLILRIRRAEQVVGGKAQRVLCLRIVCYEDVACGPAPLPCVLVGVQERTRPLLQHEAVCMACGSAAHFLSLRAIAATDDSELAVPRALAANP